MQHPNYLDIYQQSHNLYSSSGNGMEKYFNTYILNYFMQTGYDVIMNAFLQQSNCYTDTFKVAEWEIYGSSRIGRQTSNLELVAVKFYADNDHGTFSNSTPTAFYEAEVSDASFSFYRARKQYELTNHLGNVLAVISDKKIPYCTNDTFRY